MNISVRYGKGKITLPEAAVCRARLLEPNFPKIDYTDEEIKARFLRALETPVCGPSLRQAACGKRSACIVVSDKTRRYGAEIWLMPLLDELNSAGVCDDNITILFATGMHAVHTDMDRVALVGPDAAERVRLIDHNCDSGSFVMLGTTPAGTPVRINRMAAEAELLIVTGAVTPHYYAGFSGGRKSIVPGLASRETIVANHRLNLGPGSGTHPRARTAVLDGNPINEDLLDALRFICVDYAVQVIPDGFSRPAEFFTGDIVAAHDAACRRAAEWFCAPLPERLPWAIASCGGYPKDISFYQAHKSLDNAFRAVLPGGVIILMALCPEGLGPEGFEKWFYEGTPEAIEARLRENYSVMGHTALRTLEKTRAARVYLRSDLPEAMVYKMGMKPVYGPPEIERVLGEVEGEGYIIPQAAITVPSPDCVCGNTF